MIKQNLGSLIATISIIICIILMYQEVQEEKNIFTNTSSLATQRPIEEQNQSETKIETPLNKTHLIQPGDTLWDISLKYYGDGSKYPEIIKKNPGKTFKFLNGREGLIYPGTELEI
jgi:nucleoid-associated protein YgaU